MPFENLRHHLGLARRRRDALAVFSIREPFSRDSSGAVSRSNVAGTSRKWRWARLTMIGVTEFRSLNCRAENRELSPEPMSEMTIATPCVKIER